MSGTPSTSGAYTFLLKATGSPSSNYAARQFTLNVTPLSISSSTLPFGNVGTAYSQTLTATGGTGAVTWTLPAGNHLPPGLTLASNGLFSGTPTESGQYQFTVNATDTASQFRSNTFTVSIYPVGVNPPVAISNSSSFGTFSIGQVETPLTATGGNGTYTWSIVAGSLPPGISIRTDRPSCCFPIAASAGLIGIATTPGNYSFTLRVTSGGETADRASTLRITTLTAKENQLPDAFVGAAYSYALSALGNAGAVTWTPSGSLPAGLSLSAAGVVSGTPATAGFSNINFSLTDSAGTVSRSVSLNIYAVRITTPGALPDGTQNGAYSATITAAGGTGVYTFTAACCLPDGLSLSPAGVISGTVNTGPGKYQVHITARDSNNVSYSKTMSIAIVGVPAVLPAVDLSAYGTMVFDDCTIGVPCYNHAIAVTNGTAPFTWTATGLPPGMSIRTGSGTTSSWLAPGDAELWGTATATGDYNVQVTVTDANLSSATASLALHVSPLLATNVYGLANGTLDVLYSQALRVIGGDPGYTAALTAGRLPAGLTLNGGTLAVSGTPAENGSFNPVFLFTDSYPAGGKTLRVTSNLFISGGTSTISINHNGDLGSVTAWTPLVNQLSACCAAGYVWSVTSGTLPPGVTLSAGGLLTGTPTTAGPYTFLVKSADSTNAANFGARQFTLTVTAATITLSAATAVAGQSVTATVANGPANAWDWVGLYPTGATSATVNRLSYQYLNGLQTAPSSGVSGATLSFALPSAGTYEARFFRNNSLTVLATSGSITVAGPSIALERDHGGTRPERDRDGRERARQCVGLGRVVSDRCHVGHRQPPLVSVSERAAECPGQRRQWGHLVLRPAQRGHLRSAVLSQQLAHRARHERLDHGRGSEHRAERHDSGRRPERDRHNRERARQCLGLGRVVSDGGYVGHRQPPLVSVSERAAECPGQRREWGHLVLRPAQRGHLRSAVLSGQLAHRARHERLDHGRGSEHRAERDDGGRRPERDRHNRERARQCLGLGRVVSDRGYVGHRQPPLVSVPERAADCAGQRREWGYPVLRPAQRRHLRSCGSFGITRSPCSPRAPRSRSRHRASR